MNSLTKYFSQMCGLQTDVDLSQNCVHVQQVVLVPTSESKREVRGKGRLGHRRRRRRQSAARRREKERRAGYMRPAPQRRRSEDQAGSVVGGREHPEVINNHLQRCDTMYL